MQRARHLSSLRIALREERKERESVFGVDLIDRRPFELPLDRGYYADLRVTPGAKGWFHRAHLHSASPAVPSICIQYCGFMSLCQRVRSPRDAGSLPWIRPLWKPISISLIAG